MARAWQDTLFEAIEQAQDSHILPQVFLAEIRDAWKDALRRRAESDDYVFQHCDKWR